jgi:hypothetical protein
MRFWISSDWVRVAGPLSLLLCLSLAVHAATC